MDKFSLKTPEQIRIMAEGGKILGMIRRKLAGLVNPGITTMDIENLANDLISKSGGQASFKMVPGYHHATCINVNEVVVHGIPDQRKLKEGDVVGIDVGLFYKGWHTDTSVTVGVGKVNQATKTFLDTGEAALMAAIAQARPGNRIMDLSIQMQDGVEKAGYAAVRSLTGHGIGRHLHEEPAIPCFRLGNRSNSPLIQKGMVIAVEIMYNAGAWEVEYKNDDGWTIVTADGKISGLFEHTLAIGDDGPVVLTD